MTPPRLVLVLSENHTLVPPRNLGALVDVAVEAERAGFDGVMVSEHVVLGRGADAAGLPANPRDYALPGNQDPATPWPSSLLLLAAVAARTTRLRVIASAVIAPLRHPLTLAKEVATLDLLSEGRLVVQPTVSWHRAEYDALGIDFATRGARLDEHLAAWKVAWRDTPAAYHGAHYAFDDVWLEPKPWRADGPALWFGGEHLHDALLRRIVEHGHGFNPLGAASDEAIGELRRTVRDAGRDPAELELVGGTRGRFDDPRRPAPLDPALDAIPQQVARGFGTICIKPSQFTDDAASIPGLLARIVDGVAARCP
ncbi:MAG TPA: TIGR03619 family F420-dependent LLM class oxidoreductase [Actinomycetota bacterium]|nr:TIGR03619 family F420-dependent LLM class oxidoreductase [Actinomycetota bacterium]